MDEEQNSIEPQKGKKKAKKPVEEFSEPEKMDLKAAHRKVMMVMIGIFLAILALMVLMQSHVEFASSGGM